jgi:hypothetical protein
MKQVLLSFFLVISFGLIAQQDKTHRFEHNIMGCFHIGASTPVSLPATIREINGYKPGLAPSVGYDCVYHLRKKWSVGSGVRFDYKGMTVKDKVMYMRTRITVESGSSTGTFEGYFTGKNETRVHNAYLTLPLYVGYDINAKWRLKFGGYAAWLANSVFDGNVSDGYMRNETPMGEKIMINYASFNLTSEQNKWDFGLNAGADRVVMGKVNQLAVTGVLFWGLRPVLSQNNSSMDFKMYNIYLMLGVVYRTGFAKSRP